MASDALDKSIAMPHLWVSLNPSAVRKAAAICRPLHLPRTIADSCLYSATVASLIISALLCFSPTLTLPLLNPGLVDQVMVLRRRQLVVCPGCSDLGRREIHRAMDCEA